jgi:MFS family permease
MPVSGRIAVVFFKGIGFLQRQKHAWKITAIRACLDRFVYQMALPYLSVYTVALGATGTQLGLVNSAGMAAASLLSPFTGWLIDRIGTKGIYLAGISLVALSYLTYGVAQSWPVIAVALFLYWLGFTTGVHACSTVCGNSLTSEDRATAMSCCETLGAGLMGMLGPMLGAVLVTSFGGANARGIRPIFFICFAGAIGSLLLVATQLPNQRWGNLGRSQGSFLEDLSQVFKTGHHLRRFLVINTVAYLPMGMLLPFTHVFAREFKGADSYVLGAMVTGFAFAPFLFGVPMGRLADRIGRKRVLYLTAPVFWASNIMLVWAPSSFFLILAGGLQGFFFVNLVITGAMTFELVPQEVMGRWIGIVRFFRLLLTASLALVAGIIWDHLGPTYVFLTVMGLDVLIRIPLLVGMPETLGSRGMARPSAART